MAASAARAGTSGVAAGGEAAGVAADVASVAAGGVVGGLAGAVAGGSTADERRAEWGAGGEDVGDDAFAETQVYPAVGGADELDLQESESLNGAAGQVTGGADDGEAAVDAVVDGGADAGAGAVDESAATGASAAAGGRAELLRGIRSQVAELTEVRVRFPERVAEGWLGRRTRALVGDDGRLLIVAADHPARGALGVRGDRMAMGSRAELVARLMVALQRPGVDGVLATPDVLEDLLLLGALEGKVVIGSMNRGGLQGAAFELDDRFTAYRTADEIAARRLDGGKMLTRIDLADPGTVATLESSAAAVTGLAEHKLMAMVEPFWSARGEDGRVTNLLDPDSVIKSIQIASGLGATSAYTWLKLPVVDELERVMEATTLPTLLLGGDPTAAPEATYASWGKALELPSVRGLVVGRALLFPPDGDVAAAVDHAAALVHGSN
ncbi:MAG TPA: deoxyribose-phosphate aldolase [Kribbella sp.]|nr:deoxyribose-phosphate aldolase [Kribbella sp.]